jgi:hypothetical protein
MELLKEPNNREMPIGPISVSKRYVGARWFIHGQGHTIGPLAEQDILVGYKKGEYLPSDRVFSAQDGKWVELQCHAIFSASKPFSSPRRAADFERLPSPRTLRAKEVAAPISLPIPTAPVVEAEAPAFAPPEPEIVAILEEPKEVAAPAPPALEPVQVSKVEDDPEDDLIQAALELERALDRVTVETPSPQPSVAPLVNHRLDFQPVVIPEPVFVASNFPESKQRAPKIIQFQFKLPERPARFFVFWLLILGTAWGALTLFPKNHVLESGEDKTRGLNDFRLSDPSSPTSSPQEADDPIPPLKAPARPQRD